MIKKRALYFSEKIKLLDKKFPTKEAVKAAKEAGNYDYPVNDNTKAVKELSDSNLVSSLCNAQDAETGADLLKTPSFVLESEFELHHYPTIDIDFPAYAVPSRTPGHTHLYIDKAIPWSKYLNLLEAMADCGLVEQGYLEAAKKEQKTFLRVDSYKRLLKLEKEVKVEQPTPKIKTNDDVPAFVFHESPTLDAPKYKEEVYYKKSYDFTTINDEAEKKGYKYCVGHGVYGDKIYTVTPNANHTKKIYKDTNKAKPLLYSELPRALKMLNGADIPSKKDVCVVLVKDAKFCSGGVSEYGWDAFTAQLPFKFFMIEFKHVIGLYNADGTPASELISPKEIKVGHIYNSLPS